MTQKDYLDQNAKGYESDTFVHGEIKALVLKHSINLIIETGTYLGATTKRLAEFAPVYTIEVKSDHFVKAKSNLRGFDAIIIQGNSAEKLTELIPTVINKKILFFLDAHWEQYWPLLDELRAIAANGIKPVIVIHDFFVPGKDFGFDSYKGVPLDFDYIHSHISAIYGSDYKYHYNSEANGAKRGLIYIEPA